MVVDVVSSSVVLFGPSSDQRQDETGERGGGIPWFLWARGDVRISRRHPPPATTRYRRCSAAWASYLSRLIVDLEPPSQARMKAEIVARMLLLVQAGWYRRSDPQWSRLGFGDVVGPSDEGDHKVDCRRW